MGYFTLDNAENNAVAMQELENLLTEHEMYDFHHLNHRIRCYAHIINICSSHIISSMTSVSKSYLSDLKVPVNSDRIFRNNSKDEFDGDVVDVSAQDIPKVELDS